MAIWKSIVETTPHAPEAPEADLEWARALRRSGDTQASVQRLEHLILTYSESALVPQARRELELARRAIPVGTDTSSRHQR
jgi:TolA-binding protein